MTATAHGRTPSPRVIERKLRPARRDRLPAGPLEKVLRWALRGFVALVFAFLVIPILIVVIESFNSVDYLSFPLEGWSLVHYERFFGDPAWIDATLQSAKIAVLAAVIATVVGTMGAWGLARTPGRGTAFAFALMYSPIVVPIIVLAMSYYFAFAGLRLVGDWVAIAVAYSVMGVPYVLVSVSSALQQLDPELENAARTLGARMGQTLRRITLPQLTSAISAGALFAFVIAFDEAVIILFVAGSDSVTLARRLWDSVRYDLTPTLAVAGTVLIAVCVGLFLITELIKALRERRRS
ncbi:ABC transporter permease [Spongiactinospora sp. TRM90649]|uniref:ABC transporter permease n=1 Tax=Spongiactinospora sp. TRM90649 TaxID=3031114 RepID=UPI0023F61EE4|nr:ABC transporter permease [Spongiactinospora sp. TRM90649]MDF5751668.1 ABC transporter permease [Spongiactinospora sp. TRM90649]